MTSFWEKLPRPFFIMAPLADVTDPAWRALVAKHGRPDVTYTEFVSADGLWHLNKAGAGAANPLMRDLQYTEAERPIVAQFFTSKPEMSAYAAKIAEELGFDGVDINMGCPDRSIENQGAGAALIKTPELAQKVIKAAQEATALPVSVKTRIGFSKEIIDEWIPALLETQPAALIVHLRTRKEMSLVPAHWELMPKIVELRNKLAPACAGRPGVPVVGNGDVKDLEEARAKCAEYGCDGVMIGRGAFGNPWVFTGRKSEAVPFAEKADALIELACAFEKLSPPKSFHILKKHIKAFITGFDGASELRARLMECENATQLEAAMRSGEGKTWPSGPERARQGA